MISKNVVKILYAWYVVVCFAIVHKHLILFLIHYGFCSCIEGIIIIVIIYLRVKITNDKWNKAQGSFDNDDDNDNNNNNNRYLLILSELFRRCPR